MTTMIHQNTDHTTRQWMRTSATVLRWLFERLPLPMLALSAAYGVWSFNSLFVPPFFALVSAGAFELVYVSLSVARVQSRVKALWIAGSAVAVSVIYNSLAGLFHLRPALLADKLLIADVALAVLHGLPLAVLAYFVADLLLHDQHQGEARDTLSCKKSQDTTDHTPAPTSAPHQGEDTDEWATVRLDQCGTTHHTNGHRQNGLAVSPETTGATTTLVEVPPDEVVERLRYTCERCGERLTLGQYGASKRNGYCRHCKDKHAPEGWRE